MKANRILVIATAICISGTSAVMAQEIYATPQYQTYGAVGVYDSVLQPIQQGSYEVPYVQNGQFSAPYSVSPSYPAQAFPTVQAYPQPASATRTASYSGNYYSSTSPTPGLAQQKAEQAANMGYRNHVGGSLGGAKYEGVGWSNQSSQAAISNCCYWGQRTPAQIGVSKGADGCWYACVLYH